MFARNVTWKMFLTIWQSWIMAALRTLVQQTDHLPWCQNATSSAIASLFEWEVHHDLSDSDHFPILLKLFATVPEYHWPTWVLRQAGWDRFLESITSYRYYIACDQRQYPTSSSRLHYMPVPWRNEDCAAAIRKKRHRYFFERVLKGSWRIVNMKHGAIIFPPLQLLRQ